MRTIETVVYTYDELSDEAKAKARDWYREASAGDNYFAESVIEDAATIAALMGIELKQRACQTVGGKTLYVPAISWSGFSQQGDGASFEGSYGFVPDALARVKDHAPIDETLHAIAARLDALQARHANRLTASITLSGHSYCHSGMMQVDAEALDEDSEAVDLMDDDIELRDTLRAFANWIYRQLEQEYNYTNEDEQVAETIRANEYEFTADGKREG